MFCLARENVLLLVWGGLGRFDWLRLLELFLRLQERDICVAADELMYLGMHVDAMVPSRCPFEESDVIRLTSIAL